MARLTMQRKRKAIAKRVGLRRAIRESREASLVELAPGEVGQAVAMLRGMRTRRAERGRRNAGRRGSRLVGKRRLRVFGRRRAGNGLPWR